MKKLIQLTTLVAVFLFNGLLFAQTNSPKLENSLLWEVAGNGLTKTSYLYGTIHMICSADYFVSEKTKKAFDASEKLVLEINFSDPKEMAEMQQLAMGKEPLSKTLTTEQLAKLDAILKKSAGMTIQQVDAFSLVTVMSLISMKSFGCPDLKFYEMDFLENAKKKNLEVIGLETVKNQMQSLENAYNVDEMISMLEKSDTEEANELVSAYKNENLEGMFKSTTTADLMTPKTRKYILDDRNLNWAIVLPQLMKKQSLFVAVGSAHLAGDLGLITLLRKAGYTVKPVLN